MVKLSVRFMARAESMIFRYLKIVIFGSKKILDALVIKDIKEFKSFMAIVGYPKRSQEEVS